MLRASVQSPFVELPAIESGSDDVLAELAAIASLSCMVGFLFAATAKLESSQPRVDLRQCDLAKGLYGPSWERLISIATVASLSFRWLQQASSSSSFYLRFWRKRTEVPLVS
jgi:hypothetical protein